MPFPSVTRDFRTRTFVVTGQDAEKRHSDRAENQPRVRQERGESLARATRPRIECESFVSRLKIFEE
jgi:hypothetical protein